MTYTSPLITDRHPDAPALWVGCLAAYNAGKLHGAWMQASSDTAEMYEAISEILAASPEAPAAEEWEIMDTENMPSLCRADVYAAAEYVAALEALKDYTTAAEIVAAWVEWRGSDEMDAEKIQDAYLGQFDSVEDYAWQYIDDSDALREVPEYLRPYVNVAALGRDMELSGDIYHGKHGHTFNGHA